MVSLRRVQDERPPLTAEELQSLGNALTGKARGAAIDAVRKSMRSEFLQTGPVQRVDVLRWRAHAAEAVEAWREVEALTTELINEMNRTRRASK